MIDFPFLRRNIYVIVWINLLIISVVICFSSTTFADVAASFEYNTVRKSELLPEENYVRLNPTLPDDKIDLFQHVITSSLKQHTIPKLIWNKDDDILFPLATQLSPKYPSILSNTTLHQLNALYPDPINHAFDEFKTTKAQNKKMLYSQYFGHYKFDTSILTRLPLPPTHHSVSLPQIDETKNSHAITLKTLEQQQPMFSGVEVKNVNTLRFYPRNKPYDSLSVPDLGTDVSSKQYLDKKTITKNKQHLYKRKYKSNYLSQHSLPLSSTFLFNNPDLHKIFLKTLSPYDTTSLFEQSATVNPSSKIVTSSSSFSPLVSQAVNKSCNNGFCSTYDPWTSMSAFIQPLQTVSIDTALDIGLHYGLYGEDFITPDWNGLDSYSSSLFPSSSSSASSTSSSSSSSTLFGGYSPTFWTSQKSSSLSSLSSLSSFYSHHDPTALFSFGNDLTWLENIFHQFKYIKQYSLPPIEILEEAIALGRVHVAPTYADEFDSQLHITDSPSSLLTSFSTNEPDIPQYLHKQHQQNVQKKSQHEQRKTLLNEYAPVFSHVDLTDIINNRSSGYSSHNIHARPFIHQNGQVLTPSLQRHDTIFDVSTRSLLQHILQRDPILTRVVRQDIIYDILNGIYDEFISTCNRFGNTIDWTKISQKSQSGTVIYNTKYVNDHSKHISNNNSTSTTNNNENGRIAEESSSSSSSTAQPNESSTYNDPDMLDNDDFSDRIAQLGQQFGFPTATTRRMMMLCTKQQLSKETLIDMIHLSLLPHSPYTPSTSTIAWFHPALYVESKYLPALLQMHKNTEYHNIYNERYNNNINNNNNNNKKTHHNDDMLRHHKYHQYDMYFGWYDANSVQLPLNDIIIIDSSNKTKNSTFTSSTTPISTTHECPAQNNLVFPYVHNKPSDLQAEFLANAFSFSKSENHRKSTGELDMYRHGNELLQISSQVEFLCDRVSPKQLGTQTNLWIGGLFSTAHLHYDTLLNVYLHLHGTKRFVLMPPVNINDVHIFPSLHSHIQQAQGEWTELLHQYTTLSEFITGCVVEVNVRNQLQLLLQKALLKTTTDYDNIINTSELFTNQQLFSDIKQIYQQYFNPALQNQIYDKLEKMSSSQTKDIKQRSILRQLASKVQTTPETIPFGAFLQLGMITTRYLQNFDKSVTQFIQGLQFLFGLVKQYNLQIYTISSSSTNTIINEFTNKLLSTDNPTSLVLLTSSAIPPLYDILGALFDKHVHPTANLTNANTSWKYTSFDSFTALSTQCPMQRTYDPIFTYNEHADITRDLIDEQLHDTLQSMSHLSSQSVSSSSKTSTSSSSELSSETLSSRDSSNHKNGPVGFLGQILKNNNSGFHKSNKPAAPTPAATKTSNQSSDKESTDTLSFTNVQHQRYKYRPTQTVFETKSLSTNTTTPISSIPITQHSTYSSSSGFTFHSIAKIPQVVNNTSPNHKQHTDKITAPSIVDIIDVVGLHSLFIKSVEKSLYNEQKPSFERNTLVCIYHPGMSLQTLIKAQSSLFVLDQNNQKNLNIANDLCIGNSDAIIVPMSYISQLASFFRQDSSLPSQNSKLSSTFKNSISLSSVRAPFWLSYSSEQIHRVNAGLLTTLQTFFSLPLPKTPTLFQYTDYVTLFDWFWTTEFLPQNKLSHSKQQQHMQQLSQKSSESLNKYILQKQQQLSSPYLNDRLLEYLSPLRPMWVDLQPSDVLFLPPFYLHHVHALTPSISYNTWCSHADGNLQMIVQRSNMRLSDVASSGYHKAINAALWLYQVNDDYTRGAGQLIGEMLYSRYASHIQYLFNVNPFCQFSRISTFDGEGNSSPKNPKNGDPMIDLGLIMDMMTKMTKQELYYQQQKKNKNHQNVNQRFTPERSASDDIYLDKNGYDYRSLYYHSPCELILSQPRVDEMGLYLISLVTQRLQHYDNVLKQRLAQFKVIKQRDPRAVLTPEFFDLFSEKHGANSFNNRSTTLENIVHNFKYSPIPVNQLKSDPSQYISFKLDQSVMELATVCNMGLQMLQRDQQVNEMFTKPQFFSSLGSTDAMSNRQKSQQFIQQLLQYGESLKEGGVGRVEKEVLLFERFEHLMTEELHDPITAQLFMLGCFSTQIYNTHKAKGGIIVPEQ